MQASTAVRIALAAVLAVVLIIFFGYKRDSVCASSVTNRASPDTAQLLEIRTLLSDIRESQIRNELDAAAAPATSTNAAVKVSTEDLPAGQTVRNASKRLRSNAQESAADLVADKELRVPPLLRTSRRTVHKVGDLAPGKVRGDFRVFGEMANPYVGEYGWVFVRYTSSKLEQDFYRDVAAYEDQASWSALAATYRSRIEALLRDSNGRVAPHTPYAYSDSITKECNTYVRALQGGEREEQLRGGENTCLGKTADLNKELFSQFEYEFQCLVPPCTSAPPSGFKVGAKHTSYIEPLAGILRHPNAFLHEARVDLLNKEYMIVDKWALHHLRTRYQHRRRKSHFFDLGASTYTDGAGGPSQVWFEGLGECLCVPFSTMHLWEATSHDPKEVWRQVPDHLQPRYQWYNQPLSSSKDSWNNPLNHMLHHVSHDDVLIVKVDFDQVRTEADIVRTIIETPELHSQIDELFFEHHVKLGPMTGIWGHYADQSMKARDSIDLFLKLRKLGIRAHSWV